MNLKHILFHRYNFVESSCSSCNVKVKAPKGRVVNVVKAVYPEDFAEAMFGIFTERDLKI